MPQTRRWPETRVGRHETHGPGSATTGSTRPGPAARGVEAPAVKRTLSSSGTIRILAIYSAHAGVREMMKPGYFADVARMRLTSLLALAAVVVLSAPPNQLLAAGNHPALSPHQDFSNPLLQIHAPDSEGWFGSERTDHSIVFGKAGSSAHESIIASVILFHLPPFSDTEAFTEHIREAVITGSPKEEFETLDVNVQYSAEREYPCVTYHGVSNQKKVRVSFLSSKTLRFEIFALYCQHPNRPGLGFMAAFSRRGGGADANMEQEAASFINSIQVTQKSGAPQPKTGKPQ